MNAIKLETIIGLETHVQLRTASKLFCRCDNDVDDKEPNTQVCPVCMGHPGTLPVPNKQAIEWAVLTALALNCKIATYSKFDRKSYFYPDLPKGYQISQFDEPIGIDGHLMVTVGGREYRVRIERLHLEEDAAKLIHSQGEKTSLVDFNRAGTPLIEIVTKPDIPSPEVAKAFLQELRLIMRYLNVSYADMEKGQLRCDANISLKPVPNDFQRAKKKFDLKGDIITLFPKTEIKNLNSFRSVERALKYEIQRQTKLWGENKPPMTEMTRGWDEKKLATAAHREKEAINDYRYFSEPDIPPYEFSQKFIHDVRDKMVELPHEKRKRFEEQLGIKPSEANTITDDKYIADFTEETISELRAWLIALEEVEGTEKEIWEKYKTKLVKLVISWITSRLFTLLKKQNTTIKQAKITPENFAELMTLIYQRRINSTNAQVILEKMFLSGKDPSNIMETEDLGQIAGDDIGGYVDEVIKEFPQQVEQYKAGKTNVLQFLIGHVMKKSKGKADPEAVNDLIVHRIK
ncbi:Asp-tRNA(Asn)/Glu-tRNA(Gln) amidotransferase subunit GatB [Patescibacteria group bacterium]